MKAGSVSLCCAPNWTTQEVEAVFPRSWRCSPEDVAWSHRACGPEDDASALGPMSNRRSERMNRQMRIETILPVNKGSAVKQD